MSLARETEEPLPAYKQELINWLEGFQHTQNIIAMIRHFALPPEEAAAWRRQFESWLTPKATYRKEMNHARALG